MRVLHLSSGNLYGGIERLLLTFAGLRDRFPQLQPVFGLCFEGQLADELRATGAEVVVLPSPRFSRPWTVWRTRNALSSWLKANSVDVAICHACWPHAVFAPAVRQAGVPLVFWAHDVPDGRHWLEHLASWTPPDLGLTNSRFTQSAIHKLFPRVRCDVSYSPIAPNHPGERAKVREAIRGRLPGKPDDVVLLLASRFEGWKGHRLLIAALAQLRDLRQWTAWVTGRPQRPAEEQYLAELKSLAGQSGLEERLHFIGQQPDIEQVFLAADIHCQPNVSPEPFGAVFVEALYAGLPVVTTDMGGAQEIVTPACGILTHPNDPKALADALRSLITDENLRAKLGASGPARAAELCDPARRFQALHEIFRGIRSSA